jgi:hypothetical protein
MSAIVGQMITAMPAVNPAITGSGMNLMMAPRRAIPAAADHAASRVAICSRRRRIEQ